MLIEVFGHWINCNNVDMILPIGEVRKDSRVLCFSGSLIIKNKTPAEVAEEINRKVKENGGF